MKLRINPDFFVVICVSSAFMALVWGAGADHTETHFHQQWGAYSANAWWVARIAFALWIATLLLGTWAKWYLTRKRRKSLAKPRAVPAFDKLGKKGAYLEKHPDL